MSLENPIEKPAKTEGSSRPADEHSSQAPSPIPPTTTVPQSAPAPEEQRRPQEKHRDWVDYATIGLEIVGLAVLITYTTFAALQWRANKKAAEAAAKAAKVASDTLIASNVFNWRSQRAWLVISVNHTVTFTGPVSMEIILDNLGITEAKKLDGWATIQVVRKGEVPNLSQKNWKTKLSLNSLVPKFHKTIPIGAYKVRPDIQTPITTDEIAPGMKNGNLSLLIYGTLNYVDAWKVTHWIKFCDSAGAYKPGPNNPCADYNDADENEPEQ